MKQTKDRRITQKDMQTLSSLKHDLLKKLGMLPQQELEMR